MKSSALRMQTRPLWFGFELIGLVFYFYIVFDLELPRVFGTVDYTLLAREKRACGNRVLEGKELQHQISVKVD